MRPRTAISSPAMFTRWGCCWRDSASQIGGSTYRSFGVSRAPPNFERSTRSARLRQFVSTTGACSGNPARSCFALPVVQRICRANPGTWRNVFRALQPRALHPGEWMHLAVCTRGAASAPCRSWSAIYVQTIGLPLALLDRRYSALCLHPQCG
jgi:hypothetical protein